MGFRFSNFSGDPFAITTISFGVISWIIAIVGAAISPASAKLRFTWWGLVYEIILIMAIFILYLNQKIELYKFSLVALLAAAFIYTTNSTNLLIYHSHSLGNMCCAAGCILLSALNVLWVIYFGAHPESPTNQYVDSFSANQNTFSQGQSISITNNNKNDRNWNDRNNQNNRNNDDDSGMPRTASQSFPSIKSRQSQMSLRKTGYMFSSLNGMENTDLQSSSLYSPNVQSHFQSNPSPNLSSDPSFNLSCDPSINMQSNSSFNPQSKSNFNPQSNSNFNPQSNHNFNPQSNSGFNSQSNSGFNPQSNTGFKSPVSPFWNNHRV